MANIPYSLKIHATVKPSRRLVLSISGRCEPKQGKRDSERDGERDGTHPRKGDKQLSSGWGS